MNGSTATVYPRQGAKLPFHTNGETTMRVITTFLFAILVITSARSGEISLVFNHQMGGKTASIGGVVPMDNGRYFFKLTRLQYYVSGVTLYHDGDKKTVLAQKYFLVNVAESQRYVLGSFEIGSLDSVVYYIGVDRLKNHLDPTQYLPTDPLALQDPSMHWGWAAGYRFIVLEGLSGNSPQQTKAGVELHSVGDTLYRRVMMKGTMVSTFLGKDIAIDAEYASLFKGIDASLGLVLHGYGPETIAITENMASSVFSPAVVSSVQSNDQASAVSVGPNPTSEFVSVTTADNNATVRIFDALGRLSATANINAGTSTISTSMLPPGTYSVMIDAGGTSVTHVPLAIIR